MSQKCSECGRETQLGEPLKHYPGCDHWRQTGDWHGRMHREYLNGPFNKQANSHGAGVSK